MDSGNRSGVLTGGLDTNVTVPWPTFLLMAVRRYPGRTLPLLTAVAVPALAVAGGIVLFYPAMIQYILVVGLLAYIAATVLVERSVTRAVMVILPDQDRVQVDEQRWWFDDERAIPDVYKLWNGKRAIAWLYPVEGGSFMPFSPWNPAYSPLKLVAPKKGTAQAASQAPASSAHIAGIRTTMNAAGRIARHRTPDGKEIARYGLMAMIILFGLLAVYLAGNKAIDATRTTEVLNGPTQSTAAE